MHTRWPQVSPGNHFTRFTRSRHTRWPQVFSSKASKVMLEFLELLAALAHSKLGATLVVHSVHLACVACPARVRGAEKPALTCPRRAAQLACAAPAFRQHIGRGRRLQLGFRRACQPLPAFTAQLRSQKTLRCLCVRGHPPLQRRCSATRRLCCQASWRH